MMTPQELHALVRDSAGTRVLTVYLDARVTDPALRQVWRPALTAAVRDARAAIVSESERAEFDRAAAHLDRLTPDLGGVWSAPGWVAFLTPDGPLHAAGVPVQVPTLAVWRDGAAVSPYLRVLKQHRPVIVTLVDSRSARFFRYAEGRLTPLPEMTLAVGDALALPSAAPSVLRATSSPAPRGALGTERTSRRRRTSFQRLAARLGARVATLAGDDGWVVVGGTPAWARLAGEALAPRFAERLRVVESLDHDATEHDIARAAEEAASALRATQGHALFDRLVERLRPQGRAEIGLPATQRALHAQAVNLLLVSPAFLRTHGRDAEDLVRTALTSGAAIEVLSAGAADVLDGVADGIAARLRFPIDRATSPRA